MIVIDRLTVLTDCVQQSQIAHSPVPLFYPRIRSTNDRKLQEEQKLSQSLCSHSLPPSKSHRSRAVLSEWTPDTHFNPHLPMEGDCLPGGSTTEFSLSIHITLGKPALKRSIHFWKNLFVRFFPRVTALGAGLGIWGVVFQSSRSCEQRPFHNPKNRN